VRRAVSSPRVRPGATARPAVAAALLHGARHPRPASCRLHLRHHSQCSALGTGGAGRRRAGRAGPAQRHSSRAALPSLGRDPPGRAGAAGPDGRAARHGGRPAAARRRNLRADPRAEVQSGAESTVVTEHGDVKAEHVVLATGMPSRTGRGISPGWSPELRDTITTAYTAPMAHAGAMIKYARTSGQCRDRARSRATSSAHQRRHRFRDAARPQRSTTAKLNGPRAR